MLIRILALQSQNPWSQKTEFLVTGLEFFPTTIHPNRLFLTMIVMYGCFAKSILPLAAFSPW